MSQVQIVDLYITTSLVEISSNQQNHVTGGRYDYTDPERLEALLSYCEEGVYNLNIELDGDSGSRLIFTPVDRDSAPLGVYETWPI